MTAHKESVAAEACTLRFPQLDREISSRGGETVYQAARNAGVRIIGACGGRGSCGTCQVLIVEGRTEPIKTSGSSAGGSSKPHWLRACQVKPLSDCVVEIAARSLAPIVRAEPERDDSDETLTPDSAVIGRDIAVPEPTLADNAADFERVVRALGEPATTIDLAAARQLPVALRDGGWSLRAYFRGGEVIGVAPTGGRTLGLAIDLGTTNVAGFLIDLESGRRLANLGIENPQMAWGADVISRMNHAIQGAASAAELRRAAVTAINALAHDLCVAVGAQPSEIVDVAICGNTAMHHLLLGLPVRQLGRAPFVAALRETSDLKARDLDLTVCPGSYVHVAPNIGGFVGGDHVTALLATWKLWREATTALIMDIGTNTEISLVHRGEIASASCPSGPALEGGNISCGMRAALGAIERVAVVDGRLRSAVIGRRRPVGLCGSGVIDTLAALRRAGIVDDRGRMGGAHPDVDVVHDIPAAVLAPGVSFTQHDVRAVQLAKAAIRTGLELLLRERGLDEGDIELAVIAGAFGAYIDIDSAVIIGLLPNLPRERFRQVGNAAGAGIRRLLVSRPARQSARELAARCRYVELSMRSDFQKTFLHNIGFKQRRAL